MKQYGLTIHNDLLFTRAALQNNSRIRVVTLLIDTGSTFSIVSWEVLLSLRLDPSVSNVRRRIVTANGLLVLPEVKLDQVHCLGKRAVKFSVLAHSIPMGNHIEGMLGMDFLRKYPFLIDLQKGKIQVRR